MNSREVEAIETSAPERTAQALLSLRCAVDHCNDAVFITDASGKVEFVNPAFEALIGYSASEAKQGGLALFLENTSTLEIDDSFQDAGKYLLKDVLDRGVQRRSVRVVRKDGHRIELDVAMTVIRDYEARTANIVCTGRDVTGETELQTEVRDARRLDIMGTVAGGVAHDLNNLLMVIHAYAELGLQTIYCEHPLRRNLQEILSAARRAADLTRQLLASGREFMPGMHAVKLNKIVEEACGLLPRVLGEDVELRLALDEEGRHASWRHLLANNQTGFDQCDRPASRQPTFAVTIRSTRSHGHREGHPSGGNFENLPALSFDKRRRTRLWVGARGCGTNHEA
jgi:PAS domain S-box-containing protein